MASLLKFLLDPRVLIAIALAGLLFFLYSDLQSKKIEIAGLNGEKAELIQKNEDLGRQIVSLGFMVNQLKDNLVAARKSISEMQAIREEANKLRKRLVELQNQPNACEFLKVEYEKIAIDITGMFNSGVRRKINRPDTTGDHAAPEVLPGPSAS